MPNPPTATVLTHLMDLPIDIISTKTSSRMTSAATAAARPEVKVASTGVPVAGSTVDKVLLQYQVNKCLTVFSSNQSVKNKNR